MSVSNISENFIENEINLLKQQQKDLNDCIEMIHKDIKNKLENPDVGIHECHQSKKKKQKTSYLQTKTNAKELTKMIAANQPNSETSIQNTINNIFVSDFELLQKRFSLIYSAFIRIINRIRQAKDSLVIHYELKNIGVMSDFNSKQDKEKTGIHIMEKCTSIIYSQITKLSKIL